MIEDSQSKETVINSRISLKTRSYINSTVLHEKIFQLSLNTEETQMQIPKTKIILRISMGLEK